MKDFVFIQKSTQAKATLRTDIIDGNGKFTIMWMEGVQETYFQSIMPFREGSVISLDMMKEWFEDFKTLIDGYIYGGEQIVVLGSNTFDLTITPTIAPQLSVKMTLNGTKDGAVPIQDEFTLISGVVKTLKIIEGYKYKLVMVTGGATITTGDPGEFTATADKAVTLVINAPNPT